MIGHSLGRMEFSIKKFAPHCVYIVFTGPTWKAVEPLVDAWVLQGGEITGFAPQLPGIEKRVASALELIGAARKDGKEVYMYNNELSIIDLSTYSTLKLSVTYYIKNTNPPPQKKHYNPIYQSIIYYINSINRIITTQFINQ